jgi:radical SAM superfamily enzyme YgiQ (UPF0313 family)
VSSVVLRPAARRRSPGGRRPVDVVLIGFQDQGNLGMGYLAAVLDANDYRVRLLEFRDGVDAVVSAVRELDPLVVGFSLIFQFYLPDYATMATALRRAGVDAHFTMGGHYASLCHDEVLPVVPELDSVARFEGEHTLLDLVRCLEHGDDWHSVAGLAYLDNGTVEETAPRALVEDLDTLPHPLRQNDFEQVLGWYGAPVLASRGCARRCSFCSIHTFYRTAPGKVVRVRRPDKVVAEMRELYEQRSVSIFLFQDDDFPLWGRAGKVWVADLADELDRTGLGERVIWKISCRAEYLEPELFRRLRQSGLYLVYMGLESGNDEGLEVLNKRIDVSTNRRAVQMLKDLDILFEYGFMLFDPSSTFESVITNVAFLRSIVGDGSAGAVFCRMLPYGGTPIRDQLASEGRLRGDVTRPDYDFLDPRLDQYHRLLDAAVGCWIHGHGLSHQLNWAWHETVVMQRLVGALPAAEQYRADLAGLTARSNGELFDVVERSASEFAAYGASDALDARGTRACAQRLNEELLALRNDFVMANQAALLDAVAERERLRGPILAPQLF